jgi:hypothetical protein
LVVEQVMRATDDELLVVPFQSCQPGSQAFFTAVGRLLCTHPGSVPPGSPVHRWSASQPAAAASTWQEACPPQQMSLWGELVMLRQLTSATPASQQAAADPLTELARLRRCVS